MLSVAVQDALAATLVDEGVALLDAAGAAPPLSVEVWLDGLQSTGSCSTAGTSGGANAGPNGGTNSGTNGANGGTSGSTNGVAAAAAAAAPAAQAAAAHGQQGAVTLGLFTCPPPRGTQAAKREAPVPVNVEDIPPGQELVVAQLVAAARGAPSSWPNSPPGGTALSAMPPVAGGSARGAAP